MVADCTAASTSTIQPRDMLGLVQHKLGAGQFWHCQNHAEGEALCCLHLQEDGKSVLNNHLRFTILYHRDLETDLARIVGFEVEPFSVKHSYEGTWDATGAPLYGLAQYPSCPAQRCVQLLAATAHACIAITRTRRARA